MTRARSSVVVAALVLASCAQSPGREVGVIESTLTAEERRVRLTQIRDAAAAAGLDNGVLLAGIAQAETGLAHCWSEATWACQGPVSADCGGGPVIAGAGDGPCEDLQGGLGMFQFDAGTHEQTLAREGERILSIAGNVEAAIDFVVTMVIRSVYVDGVDTREQAIAWMDSVVVGGAGHTAWIQTVTHYYNGCTPTGCSVYETRSMHYDEALRRVWDEMGADFWGMGMAPPCEVIGAGGRVIDDLDACTTLGGDRRYWRTATDAGYGGSLRWTNATDDTAPANYATWTLRFEAGGEYELFAHLDAAYAESRVAPYTITSREGPREVIVDQTAGALQSLGVFGFEPGVDYEVRVDDDSGEPVSEMIAIVADAIEVRPVGAPDAGGIIETDAAIGADAGVARGRETVSGCGCGVASRGGENRAIAAGIALGLALMARRRRVR
ncbi:MYXO-CTERM sorting domain-containing protein [Sandaracinus amylolyticus]|uniref:golvesin C-terminal-like domain-containing protein n=1 Tax=Sandaracinus amylolyticus TaxID=927083 RepID=UPI001F3DC479|nr:MYXO-CTERM sorting domain-containing protein [Sandaracinus amylolyticus]UJR87065.1 Hypothetical protein I5071_91660 [Sandaracinus amylolyticus]